MIFRNDSVDKFMRTGVSARPHEPKPTAIKLTTRQLKTQRHQGREAKKRDDGCLEIVNSSLTKY